MNKQTKYTLWPHLSLESVYTDPINWIVVRGKDQDHSCLEQGGSIGGSQARLGGSYSWLHPSGGPLLSLCWGDGLRLGPQGLAASLPGLPINFALCVVRLAFALCLSPGPVTD